ncbi:hypothetical protein TraAM80_07362 [Trypanosoma rangeli]|uniref:Uncharacterized protein n=1 Tax=Trypanosoma rangeli TaxID=5698 RepID=A0A422N5X1_TRYRA|nr:uncharacterized protein TraAM80_07362 [Trypanosoma rangeli]RNF00846.1 hypothetical protein TraAM80_07362 [Trypanosoma rangeli]|eukprot:RNF00846.1 hypothetical protein TraAM80_07362 [Trypanosoma rangeli]
MAFALPPPELMGAGQTIAPPITPMPITLLPASNLGSIMPLGKPGACSLHWLLVEIEVAVTTHNKMYWLPSSAQFGSYCATFVTLWADRATEFSHYTFLRCSVILSVTTAFAQHFISST